MEITSNETSTACRAARALAAGDLRPTRLRNTGTVPGGSMITTRVIAAAMNSLASKKPDNTKSAHHDLGAGGLLDQRLELLGIGGLRADRDRLVGAVIVARPGPDQVQFAGQTTEFGPRGLVV